MVFYRAARAIILANRDSPRTYLHGFSQAFESAALVPIKSALLPVHRLDSYGFSLGFDMFKTIEFAFAATGADITGIFPIFLSL